MIRKLLVFLVLAAGLAFGQGAQRTPTAQAVVNYLGNLKVLSGATVTVCPASGSITNCTPGAVSLYRDVGLTIPQSNPLHADAAGNYTYYVIPGTYGELVCSPGVTCKFSVVSLVGPGSGTGSVTSFSAGNLSPLFTTSVANPTTNPALSFVLSNAAANTVFGNFTGSSGAPSYNAVAACGDLTHALGWTAGTGFICQTLTGSGGSVTDVTGTPNQIDVATGTTTPVIALDAAIIFPGTITMGPHAADFSSATSFKVPVGAGATAAANGAVAYDSTAKSTHFQTNNADSMAAAFASAPSGSKCLHTNGATGLVTETSGDCAVVSTRSISFQGGSPGGSALSTGVLAYITVPFGCTITGWSIAVDAGTATISFLKVAAGTAIPTLGSNSINTSGVAIASGTVIQSTTLTDFTTTAITANDIMAADMTATSGVGFIDAQVNCQ